MPSTTPTSPAATVPTKTTPTPTASAKNPIKITQLPEGISPAVCERIDQVTSAGGVAHPQHYYGLQYEEAILLNLVLHAYAVTDAPSFVLAEHWRLGVARGTLLTGSPLVDELRTAWLGGLNGPEFPNAHRGLAALLHAAWLVDDPADVSWAVRELRAANVLSRVSDAPDPRMLDERYVLQAFDEVILLWRLSREPRPAIPMPLLYGQVGEGLADHWDRPRPAWSRWGWPLDVAHVLASLLDVLSGPRGGLKGPWVDAKTLRGSLRQWLHDRPAMSTAEGLGKMLDDLTAMRLITTQYGESLALHLRRFRLGPQPLWLPTVLALYLDRPVMKC